MNDVSLIKPGTVEGELLLERILGEQKVVKGRLKELQLMDHKILVGANLKLIYLVVLLFLIVTPVLHKSRPGVF